MDDLTRHVIKERIARLRRERAEFKAKADLHLATLAGAILELEELLCQSQAIPPDENPIEEAGADD